MKSTKVLSNRYFKSIIPFKPKALASHLAAILVAGSAFTTSQVLAQENQVKAEDTEVIEVTGIRFSMRSALDRKKSAGTMTDSLVAEDISEFPDKNVAEALQRIPGIQLSRDLGEGNSISIRGVESDLLRVEVNNVSALGMGGGRGVDFRDMASELVKSLDVIKGSEARLTEGGIGGTIQVNTRKPNEFENNFLSVSAEGQYNDLIGDVSPKANITAVYKATDKLGFLANITVSDKSTMIHALRNTEWVRFDDYDDSLEKTSIDPNFANITDQADCAATDDQSACEYQWWDFSPRIPRYGIWGRDEKRLSANIMAQYEFTNNFSGYASYTFNQRDKVATDLNLHIESQSAGRVDKDSVVVDENHNVRYFETKSATINNRTLNFDWDQETSIFDAGFEYNKDALRVTGLVARSTSDQDIDSRDTHVFSNGVAGVQVSLDERGAPEWDLTTGYFPNSDDPTDTSDQFNVNDPSSYRSRARYKYAPSVDEAEETMFKLDADYVLGGDFFTMLRGGVQVSQSTMENASYEYNIIRNVGSSYNGVEWTQADMNALISGRTETSPELFDGYSLGISTIGTYDAIVTQPFIDEIQRIANDNTGREDLDVRSGNYDLTIDTQALYVQTHFESEIGDMEFWGNAGVRYVKTETEANGDVRERVVIDRVDDEGNPIIDENNGQISSVLVDAEGAHPQVFVGRKSINEGYSDFLPSINLNLALVPDELILYFGAAKVMAHPKAKDINVNATCTTYLNTAKEFNASENSCTAGNPDLDPYRATQMEVALTWYPDEDSIVSGTYFTKDITSWIIAADNRPNVDFFNDGRIWEQVQQPLNGTGVTTNGIELQASTVFTSLPAPFDGLGGSINYTHMTADDVGLFSELTGEELPFPTQSEDSYNITAFYETDTWNIKLAYNYRSEYLAKASDRSGNPVFVDDAGYMDAKLTYNITPNLKFYIDGRNLTSEVKLENAGPGRLSDLRWSGRTYSMGVSYKL